MRFSTSLEPVSVAAISSGERLPKALFEFINQRKAFALSPSNNSIDSESRREIETKRSDSEAVNLFSFFRRVKVRGLMPIETANLSSGKPVSRRIRSNI